MIEFLEPLLKLIVAFVLAMPAAINRERYSQIMGLRTFPLVSMGACAYAVVALGVLDPANGDATARIMQGILTGIGFIGGGAILKGDNRVRGTATAATIWGLGAMGTAVAFEQWAVAVALSIVSWLALSVLFDLKEEVDHDYNREDDVDRDDGDD
mgnify:FL=1